MHGQTHCDAHMKKYAFYVWEEMLIIYVGKKDAYYAWGGNAHIFSDTFYA